MCVCGEEQQRTASSAQRRGTWHRAMRIGGTNPRWPSRRLTAPFHYTTPRYHAAPSHACAAAEHGRGDVVLRASGERRRTAPPPPRRPTRRCRGRRGRLARALIGEHLPHAVGRDKGKAGRAPAPDAHDALADVLARHQRRLVDLRDGRRLRARTRAWSSCRGRRRRPGRPPRRRSSRRLPRCARTRRRRRACDRSSAAPRPTLR